MMKVFGSILFFTEFPWLVQNPLRLALIPELFLMGFLDMLVWCQMECQDSFLQYLDELSHSYDKVICQNF